MSEIILQSGEIIKADKIISTCGIRETENLLNQTAIENTTTETGDFSVIESIRVFDGHPKDFNWNETVIFFNHSDKFTYGCPAGLVDLKSGVICLPDNYGCPNSIKEGKIRVTHPANFSKWSALTPKQYLSQKKGWEERILKNSLTYLPNGANQFNRLNEKTVLIDTFTPTTVKKFTSHVNGTLYGSPTKRRDGTTKFKNLFLAGTDQGYIGIVGSMLGGIAVANNLSLIHI